MQLTAAQIQGIAVLRGTQRTQHCQRAVTVIGKVKIVTKMNFHNNTAFLYGCCFIGSR